MRTPAAKLLELFDGCRAAQVVAVAAALDLPSRLSDGPKTSDELAVETGCRPESLRRLLRALASLDVVGEELDGRFRLGALGSALCGSGSESLRAAAAYYGSRRYWTSWGRLLDSVQTGRPAFGAASPDAFLEMANRDPEGAGLFNDAMASLSGPINDAVVKAYDFSRFDTLVDVGGGYGALLLEILAANPRLRGVLFDIPPVIAVARDRIRTAGCADRCDVVAGNAFESVAHGHDAYLMKWVLHDWNDDHCRQILASCRRAMRDGAALIIVERVLPQSGAPARDAASMFLSDLNMLVLSEGRERTESEYRSLLRTAGFELTRVVATATPHSILECTV